MFGGKQFIQTLISYCSNMVVHKLSTVSCMTCNEFVGNKDGVHQAFIGENKSKYEHYPLSFQQRLPVTGTYEKKSSSQVDVAFSVGRKGKIIKQIMLLLPRPRIHFS